jgi:dihydroorotate dehydrogenase
MTHRTVKNIILSPPFGTWLNLPWASSVIGTYTYRERPGNRIWQAIKTIRKVRHGWINRIGLKNPGLKHNISILLSEYENHIAHNIPIISLHGRNDWEWLELLLLLRQEKLTWLNIEMNISCPAEETEISKTIFEEFSKQCPNLIAKLPPTNQAEEYASMAYDAGIDWFHCSNTLPGKKGGYSGPMLKRHSLATIETVQKINPYIKIIGGGGIYEPQDVIDYYNAGAEKISLATVFFTPWKVNAVKEKAKELFNQS